MEALPYPHSNYHGEYMKLRTLLNKENPIIVEVGSNNGGDAIRYLHYFPKCLLHTFECDKRALTVFKNNVNNDRCQLYEYAVSDINGELTFNQIKIKNDSDKVPEKHNWMSKEDYDMYLGSANSTTSSVKLRDNEELIKVNVPCITLDKWDDSQSIDMVDLLEIDVQGGERKVLLGASKFLNKVKFIKIEYGESRYDDSISRDDTINYLKSFNFVVIESMSSKTKSGDLFFAKIN